MQLCLVNFVSVDVSQEHKVIGPDCSSQISIILENAISYNSIEILAKIQVHDKQIRAAYASKTHQQINQIDDDFGL